MSLVATLHSWHQENEESFRSAGAEPEFKDSGRGSACVRMQTDAYLMEICAWDHAFCLDIRIVEKTPRETTFPRGGSCESMDDCRDYLDEFMVWFERKVAGNLQGPVRD